MRCIGPQQRLCLQLKPFVQVSIFHPLQLVDGGTRHRLCKLCGNCIVFDGPCCNSKELTQRIKMPSFSDSNTFEYEPSFILRGLAQLDLEVEKL